MQKTPLKSDEKFYISYKNAFFTPFDPFYTKNCTFYKKMFRVTFIAFFIRNHLQKNPSKSDEK